MQDATLWNPKESSVKGTHSIFIVRGDPAAYNLPEDPVVPTTLLAPAWSSAAAAAGVMIAGALLAFAAFRR
jgi:formate dehydrogenase iron-sulfur subunit